MSDIEPPKPKSNLGRKKGVVQEKKYFSREVKAKQAAKRSLKAQDLKIRKAHDTIQNAKKRKQKVPEGYKAGYISKPGQESRLIFTPDKGRPKKRMKKGGLSKKPKVRKIGVIGVGKAKDYPGIKEIIKMNKQGKKRFGMKMGGALKPVDPKTQKGLSKLPTEVRNKMGYMKKGGKVHGK